MAEGIKGEVIISGNSKGVPGKYLRRGLIFVAIEVLLIVLAIVTFPMTKIVHEDYVETNLVWNTINSLLIFACFLPGLGFLLVGIYSFSSYADCKGVEIVITDQEVWGIPSRISVNIEECRFPLEELRELKINSNDAIEILWLAGRRAEFYGITNLDEFKKHISGELGKRIAEQDKKFKSENYSRMSAAEAMNLVNAYKESINAKAKMVKNKQRMRKIAKGAVVGGAVAGGAGAVVGALIAKDELDNE